MLLTVHGIVHLRPRAWNSMELLHSIFSEYDDLDESLLLSEFVIERAVLYQFENPKNT